MKYPMNKYELAAKTTYEAARANGMVVGEPWDKIDEVTRNQWLSVAQVAVSSYPGPISLEIYAKFPGRTPDQLPVLKTISCEASSEDIERACAELQSWLEEHTYHPDSSEKKGPPPLPKKEP